MIAIMGCVATNADTTPRVFANADDLIAEHGYSNGRLRGPPRPEPAGDLPQADRDGFFLEQTTGVTVARSRSLPRQVAC